MSNSDPRFSVTDPADAPKSESSGNGVSSAASRRKKAEKAENAKVIATVREERERAEPTTSEVLEGLHEAKSTAAKAIETVERLIPVDEGRMVAQLAMKAWVRRGGPVLPLIADAKKLVAELKKQKMI